ncbi:retinol dehydrogenase 12-like [Vanessa atalanta]|uniref:retinol dehydrogenase 12-like n=1 Tax=Vanessa atalanta TaxID=42275 RepID=UPI001FCCED4E|nr:retinol dehydrogenase 12-like [Vanessa atalanta]
MIWILLIVLIAFTCFYLYLKLSIKKCVCKTSMKGKVVIVTGASSGIGYHTAKKLALRGARTILACRSAQRGRSAQESLIAATGNQQVIFKQIDLRDLASIRRFASDILETEERLDVLVNNAGACSFADRYTMDGLLEGMQVNHYGPFLLTMLLLPLLKTSRPSRIVNVSSLMYLFGYVDLDTINKAKCNRVVVYANSKLCSLVIHQELAQRLDKSGVVVNSVHPGIILTNILSEGNFLFRMFFKVLCWFNSRTAEDGSQTVVHVSIATECASVTGKLFVDCRERYLLSRINNTVTADLWRVTERFVGYKG